MAVGTAVAGTAVGRGAVALGVGVSVWAGVAEGALVGRSVAVGDAVVLGAIVAVGDATVTLGTGGWLVALGALVGVADGVGVQAATRLARTSKEI